MSDEREPEMVRAWIVTPHADKAYTEHWIADSGKRSYRDALQAAFDVLESGVDEMAHAGPRTVSVSIELREVPADDLAEVLDES